MIPTNGDDDIFVVSASGQTIRFTEDDVRPMGRTAAGVRGMKLKRRRRGRVAATSLARTSTCCIITERGYGKRTQLDKFNRPRVAAAMGVRGIKLTDKKGQVVAAFMVGLDDEIFVISSGGTLIRMPVKEISSQGRDATGVRVMNLDDDESVAAVAPVFQEDEVDTED